MKQPASSFLLNEAFKEGTYLSLFKENHLLLGFLHKTFYVQSKEEKPFRRFPSFGITFPPTRENLVAGFPLTLSSRARGCAPYKPHTIETMPFLVLCVECSNDSTGPLCAAPSRGILRGCGTYYVIVKRQGVDCFLSCSSIRGRTAVFQRVRYITISAAGNFISMRVSGTPRNTR